MCVCLRSVVANAWMPRGSARILASRPLSRLRIKKKSLVMNSVSQRWTVANFGMVYRICARAETDQAENCQFSLVKFVCLCTTLKFVVCSSSIRGLDGPLITSDCTQRSGVELLNTWWNAQHTRMSLNAPRANARTVRVGFRDVQVGTRSIQFFEVLLHRSMLASNGRKLRQSFILWNYTTRYSSAKICGNLCKTWWNEKESATNKISLRRIFLVQKMIGKIQALF